MSKNIKQDIQFEALKDLLKSCKKVAQKETEILVLYAVSYFATIGGWASEHNLLTLLRHIGVDITDSKAQSVVYHLFSYYSGAEIISIVDNGYGLKEMIEDPSTESYNKGRKAQTAELLLEIEINRNLLLKRIGHSIEEFNCEDG